MSDPADRHFDPSCEPDCVADEIEHKDKTLALVIEAVRSAKRGEKRLLDYGPEETPHQLSASPQPVGRHRLQPARARGASSTAST